MESKMQEFEIEMERPCSRMEHLKSQNEVLALSLGESRAHSDHLKACYTDPAVNGQIPAVTLTGVLHGKV